MKRIALVFLLTVAVCYVSLSQKPYQKSSSEIELALRKLNVLGSVLYVAAHPDDENTRLIAFLSNEMLANTAYLSMTRGDGGQNLIGPEIREYLGIIRTQELLAARRVDGGQQFFTRANDFGYSKSPEETQEIWERDEVLKDVIRTFRKFKPDVVITRFPIDGGGGHGHHTTSAILAHEAFRISGQSSTFPDDLSEWEPWSPKRLYLNTGRWWNQSIDKDSEGVIYYDVGKYNPLLGSSYSEIAAVSRTQHKSQGFGSTGSRGEQFEFLEHRLGETADSDIFDGINTKWSRVDGGEKVQPIVDKVIREFNSSNPAASVKDLIEIRKAIQNISDDYWKAVKLKEVDQLIKDCMGLYLEVTADDFSAVAGQTINVRMEAVNRSSAPAFLRSVKVDGAADTVVNLVLNKDDDLRLILKGKIPSDMPVSQPYWLVNKGSLGMYQVDDPRQIGKPENDASVMAEYNLEIFEEKITLTSPLVYKWNDPVKGEQYRPFVITPPIYLNNDASVMVFAGNEAKEIEIIAKSAMDNVSGVIQMTLPSGWKSEPSQREVNLDQKGEEQRLVFKITPPKNEGEGNLKVSATVNGKQWSQSLVEISYDHIPIQTAFPESSIKLVKIDLEKSGNVIGYIQGAGDEIPDNLRSIGYDVVELTDDEINSENLSRFDAVVMGVRALNTRERLQFAMEDLLEYVKMGGTLVFQYNTNRGLVTERFAPYPLQISRDRVSREAASVTILEPEHPVINGPNKISDKDFENWVQERGLYFPDTWSDEYSAILSSNDPGEDSKRGGLLVAKYGDGYYVYSGYSWFRQLPAGVPGAYKIFTNILSLGNTNSGVKEASAKKSANGRKR